ncbi:hypothetical protein ACMD2_09891 [Ananas comosus]|uniref:DUF3741 domain-containing protein n=1 Tax=Ananas comosus TaxID=4615 RepID=A0A199VME0_ANACO|nr:hypothetical protein ACMD2_09891 [Ananas comosus]
MHQDSFRSVVHRSLSKSLPSKSKDKNETTQFAAAAAAADRIQKSSPSFASKPNFGSKERGEQKSSMACRDSSEAQLLKVSRGAQSLTQVINSWSREPNFSKHFAEDLLRGALDLQESLVMLENFQAASKSFSRMNDIKRKQEMAEEGIEGEIEEEVFVEATASKRFSSCGSSRYRVEELKKVIKDSFHRQNLLSASSSSRSLRYSTSSSSKVIEPHEEDTGTKKPKSSNLIAKLMGLEEAPLEEQAHPIKKEGKMRSISSPRAFFDIEMPKARRIQPVKENPDANRKALQEIVETMHFKGLLKNNQAEEHRKDDDAPPIVIMKPISSSSSSYSSEREGAWKEKEARPTKSVRKEKAADDEQVVRRTIERKESNHVEKCKGEPSQEVKASNSANGKQRKKESIKVKRSLPQEEKPISVQKKAEEKKEATRLSRSNTNNNKVLKPDKKPRATSNVSSSIKGKKTEVAQQVRSSPIIKTVTNNIKHKRDQKAINPQNQKDGVSATNGTCDDNCIQTAQVAEPCMEDDVREDQRVSCEITPNTSQVERSYSPAEEAIQCRTNKSSAKEASGIEDEIRLLLLTSPSFLSLAQELVGFETYQPVCNRVKDAGEVGIRYAKLYLDTAEEQMVRKHEQNHLFCPLFQTKIRRRRANYFSLEDLAEDISNGIGKLNSYSKFDDDGASKDDLYVKLERDLTCANMAINSMWDVGWVDLISGEDVNRVASEVSEHILSLLVQEICAD